MLSHVLLPTIVALSIVLMLVRPRGIPEVFYWIGGGALLLIALRLVPCRQGRRRRRPMSTSS
jgi:arsenical pump membrane protein